MREKFKRIWWGLTVLLSLALLFSSCSKNMFDWMHENGSSRGEDLVLEAEAYLNNGQNQKALELFEKAVPDTTGKVKARALLGAMSAKYNLVFGANGLFFLETALVIAKMIENPNTMLDQLGLTLAQWAAIKGAYDYIKWKGYFSQLATIVAEGVAEYKYAGSFLSLMGGIARMVNVLGNLTANSLSDMNPEDIGVSEADAIVDSVVGGVGGDPDKIEVTDITDGKSAIVYRFKYWPCIDVPEPQSDYYTYSCIANSNKWNNLKTSAYYENSYPSGGADTNPLTGETTLEDSNRELWYDTSTQEYVMRADSIPNSNVLKDLLKANANNGQGMDAMQEQIWEASIEALYKQ